MLIRERRYQRYGADSQQNPEVRVHPAEGLDEGPQVVDDLRHRKVHEFILVSLILASARARYDGNNESRSLRPPPLGKTESEDEYVSLLKDPAHSREMNRAVGPQLRFGREPSWLYL